MLGDCWLALGQEVLQTPGLHARPHTCTSLRRCPPHASLALLTFPFMPAAQPAPLLPTDSRQPAITSPMPHDTMHPVLTPSHNMPHKSEHPTLTTNHKEPHATLHPALTSPSHAQHDRLPAVAGASGAQQQKSSPQPRLSARRHGQQPPQLLPCQQQLPPRPGAHAKRCTAGRSPGGAPPGSPLSAGLVPPEPAGAKRGGAGGDARLLPCQPVLCTGSMHWRSGGFSSPGWQHHQHASSLVPQAPLHFRRWPAGLLPHTSHQACRMQLGRGPRLPPRIDQQPSRPPKCDR